MELALLKEDAEALGIFVECFRRTETVNAQWLLARLEGIDHSHVYH